MWLQKKSNNFVVVTNNEMPSGALTSLKTCNKRMEKNHFQNSERLLWKQQATFGDSLCIRK